MSPPQTALPQRPTLAREGMPLDVPANRLVANDLDGRAWAPVQLSVPERYEVLDAWVAVFNDVYVHYAQKRALYGFDPLRAIEALRRQIRYLDSAGFLRELTLVINRLRDQHTQLYVSAADERFTDHVAVLPFIVETCGPFLAPTYVVTKTTESVDPEFAVGSRVTTWNGLPFDRAVDTYGDTLTGGRPDARRARALETLTQRPLNFLPPPAEKWVEIGFRHPDDLPRRKDRSISRPPSQSRMRPLISLSLPRQARSSPASTNC